ncbi:MAG: hypothetical protein LBE83_01375 [Propionibacteriaceae bacterium]|jgi:hypothetical protein|nr:hypothetical protein [Propionibacteriaceae bacterium]
MKKLSLLALTAVAAIFMASCTTSDPTDPADPGSTVASTPAEDVQTVTSELTGLTLDFPTNWESVEVHATATIQMADVAGEFYALVLEESKEGVEEGVTLADYTTVVLDQMMANLGATEAPEVTDSVIGDIAVQQYVLAGVASEVELTYLVTTFETEAGFTQILIWTYTTKFEEAQAQFDAIVASLRF